MTRATSVARLVRAPAALTVPGDSFAGAAAAGWPFGRRTPMLAAASVFLYWAGMALNDWADRDIDAVERPERPIPAGDVSPRLAFVVAGGSTAVGLVLAGVAGGRRALEVAVPLAGTIWAYDLALKSTRAGAPAMALARGLDVLLGAGAGSLRASVPAALTVGAHVLGVTLLSRYEVSGTTPVRPAAAATGTAVVVAAALPRSGATRDRLMATALLGAFATTVGAAQYDAARQPSAGRIRRAVGAGILGIIPLQAALLARAGATRVAVPVGAVFPLARLLSRRVSPT